MLGAITAGIQQYVWYIVGAVIVVLLVLLGVQTVRLKVAISNEKAAKAEVVAKEAQLQAQLAAVRQLAQTGEELAARITDAQKQAEEERRRRDRDRTKWQGKAPQECVDGSKWLAEQTKELLEDWR